MNVLDSMLIMHMKQKAKVIVDTPAGATDEIMLETLWGREQYTGQRFVMYRLTQSTR